MPPISREQVRAALGQALVDTGFIDEEPEPAEFEAMDLVYGLELESIDIPDLIWRIERLLPFGCPKLRLEDFKDTVAAAGEGEDVPPFTVAVLVDRLVKAINPGSAVGTEADPKLDPNPESAP